ncbi:hypothetical protein DEO72_LG6g985 [Vigna unguiculata]|uniref:Uncharacterized protein n=1 Tax=Vigna unguiculata TaxID=3917 RepID=A0A4D6M697_VIGUN|nr:hypothetical protein DEO72_LG6g985 [Vigna unguiculata]
MEHVEKKSQLYSCLLYTSQTGTKTKTGPTIRTGDVYKRQHRRQLTKIAIKKKVKERGEEDDEEYKPEELKEYQSSSEQDEVYNKKKCNVEAYEGSIWFEGRKIETYLQNKGRPSDVPPKDWNWLIHNKWNDCKFKQNIKTKASSSKLKIKSVIETKSIIQKAFEMKEELRSDE